MYLKKYIQVVETSSTNPCKWRANRK